MAENGKAKVEHESYDGLALEFEALDAREVVENFKKDLKKKWSTKKFAKDVPPEPDKLSCHIPKPGTGDVTCYSNTPSCIKVDKDSKTYGRNSENEDWKLLEPNNDIYAEVTAAQYNQLRAIDKKFKTLHDPELSFETELKDGKYCRIKVRGKDGKPLDSDRFEKFYNGKELPIVFSCIYPIELQKGKHELKTAMQILRPGRLYLHEDGGNYSNKQSAKLRK